jgi:hypothetical protein
LVKNREEMSHDELLKTLSISDIEGTFAKAIGDLLNGQFKCRVEQIAYGRDWGSGLNITVNIS